MAAPKFDAPEIMPSGQPLRYMNLDTSPDTFGAGIGRGLQQIGKAGMQFSDMLEANAEKMRSDAAKTSANQAFIDASLRMGQAEADYFTSMGSNAQTEYPSFIENLQTIRKEALDSLGDDEAKQLFDQAIQSKMLSGIDQGSTHAAKQGMAAAVDAAEARVELVLNDSATRFADENLFQSNLATLEEQVTDMARLQGWTPEVTMQKLHTLNSAAWETRITSMAASDPIGAKKTYDRVRDTLTVESRLRIQNSVINSLETSAASLGLTDARSGYNGNVRSSFRAGILKAEGGGSGVSSPAGAVGLMQVMPETGRIVARQLGIPWDPNRLKYDDNYNLVIGTAYLNQMLDRFGGNEWLAAAAYNAGPGAVDKWVKQYGDPRLGQISNEQWAAKIPYAETRGYVAKVMGFTGPGSSPPVTAQMSRAEYDTAIEDAYDRAEVIAPGNALFAERYVGGVRSYYDQQVAENKARIAENYDSILESAVTPGPDGQLLGSQAFDAMLQNNPQFAAMWNELSGSNKKTIYDQLRTNDNRNTGSSEEVITDESLAEFDRLSGMWRTDNTGFRNEDFAANPVLTQAQKRSLIDLKRQQPPSENAPTPVDIDLSAALSVGASAIAAAGIIKGKPNTSDARKYDTFIGSLTRILNEESTRLGRKLTKVEMRDIVQNLLMTAPITRTREFLGAPAWLPWQSPTVVDESGRVFENLDAYPGREFVGAEVDPTFIPTVPQSARQAIIDQYRAKTGQTPTEALINQIYFQYRKSGAAQ